MKNIEKIPGKNPFRVPDNYFEEVNRRIISATAGSNELPAGMSLYRRIRPYMIAAAAVTGFIIISYLTARVISTGEEPSETSYAQIMPLPDLDDIDIYYLEENIKNIDPADELHSIRKSDIVDYLMYENIDTESIIEML